MFVDISYQKASVVHFIPRELGCEKTAFSTFLKLFHAIRNTSSYTIVYYNFSQVHVAKRTKFLTEK